MRMKYYLSLVFAGLLLTSCIDEIRLNIDRDQQRLVVDGLIADSLQVYTIRISYSAVIGVGNDNIQTPVPGASVRVLDDEGNSYDFVETKPGIYTREMQGDVGKSYQVEIKLENGKTLLSRPAQLKKAPSLKPGSVKIVETTTISQTGKAITTNKLELKINTSLSGFAERPYLLWRASGEYEFRENYPMALSTKTCYIKNNIDFNNIRIFDTNTLVGESLNNEPFLSTAYDYRFAFMYCFHLFQYAISKEEYEYWRTVRNIVNIDGSLFDPPPGTVIGNIYNPNDPGEQILGYFSVAGVSYRQEFVDANSLNFFVEPRCSSLSFRPQYPDCRDCSTIIMSKLERPDYWKP